MSQETVGATAAPQSAQDEFAALVAAGNNKQPVNHEENCQDGCCEVVWKPVKIAGR